MNEKVKVRYLVGEQDAYRVADLATWDRDGSAALSESEKSLAAANTSVRTIATSELLGKNCTLITLDDKEAIVILPGLDDSEANWLTFLDSTSVAKVQASFDRLWEQGTPYAKPEKSESTQVSSPLHPSLRIDGLQN